MERFIENSNAEMTVSEMEFLFSLIDQKRPKKIIEVGVAAGGTTAAILQYTQAKHYDMEMISVDKSELYYRDKSLKTGYVAQRFLSNNRLNHKFFLGKYAVECLDEIGTNIDFLILDTVHSMPGEFLDFLAFLPYLSDGAVVVLHDTCLNHCSDNIYGYATQLLLDTVSGEKIYDLSADNGIPNIGAFRVTSETRDNVEDIFRALFVTWRYDIEETEAFLYRTHYESCYEKRLIDIFNFALDINKHTLAKNRKNQMDKVCQIVRFTHMLEGKRIFLYGKGFWGDKIYHFLLEEKIGICGFIVTDKQIKSGNVWSIQQYIGEQKENDLIIVSVGNDKTDEIIEILKDNGICHYIKIPELIYEYI